MWFARRHVTHIENSEKVNAATEEHTERNNVKQNGPPSKTIEFNLDVRGPHLETHTASEHKQTSTQILVSDVSDDFDRSSHNDGRRRRLRRQERKEIYVLNEFRIENWWCASVTSNRKDSRAE